MRFFAADLRVVVVRVLLVFVVALDVVAVAVLGALEVLAVGGDVVGMVVLGALGVLAVVEGDAVVVVGQMSVKAAALF